MCVCVCLRVIIANHVHHCMFIEWLGFMPEHVFKIFFFFCEQLAHTLVSVCVSVFGRGLFLVSMQAGSLDTCLRELFAWTGAPWELFYKEPAFSVMEQIYCSKLYGFSHLL